MSPPSRTAEIFFLFSKLVGIFTAIYVEDTQITHIMRISYQITDISRGYSVSCPYSPAIIITAKNPIKSAVRKDGMTMAAAS